MTGNQLEKRKLTGRLDKIVKSPTVTVELNGIKYRIIALGESVRMTNRTIGTKWLTEKMSIYMYIPVIL